MRQVESESSLLAKPAMNFLSLSFFPLLLAPKSRGREIEIESRLAGWWLLSRSLPLPLFATNWQLLICPASNSVVWREFWFASRRSWLPGLWLTKQKDLDKQADWLKLLFPAQALQLNEKSKRAVEEG